MTRVARVTPHRTYLVRLEHVGNLSAHLLLYFLDPPRVCAHHTQRGDGGARRPRLRNDVRFFAPHAEWREGGAHRRDAQSCAPVQIRAGARTRYQGRGTIASSARGRVYCRHVDRERHSDVSSALALSFSRGTPIFARTRAAESTRGLFFR